jgi:hypothetical protein
MSTKALTFMRTVFCEGLTEGKKRMLQFGNYPIYIVYSLHRQQAVEPLWKEYYNAQKLAQERAKEDLFKSRTKFWRDVEVANEKGRLIDAVFQWQVIEDLEPKYKKEIDAYEKKVRNTLTTISRTSIGKALLDSFSHKTKTWIIPANWETPTAKTELATEEQGGGIRIMFNPQAFEHVYIGPRTVGSAVEDTLFHELVHAMRYSQNRYFPRNLLKWEFHHNSEEFIAEQLANVYHSSRRESDYYGTYLGPDKRKDEMYQYFVEDAELVMALKFFLTTEPLAKFAAHLKQPDYNPFRDYKEIEARSLRHFDQDSFMDYQ